MSNAPRRAAANTNQTLGDNASWSFWLPASPAGTSVAWLNSAAQLQPADAMAHIAMAQRSLEAEDFEAALAHSDRALALAPDDTDANVMRAAVLERTGDVESAWRLLEPILRRGVASVPVALLYGRLAPTTEEEQNALSLIDAILQKSETAESDKAILNFTAGALLERQGRYDEAFGRVRLAKDSTRQPYDPEVLKRCVQRDIQFFTRARLSSLRRATHAVRRPVFIIGMPRSGTTLIEQILASHPDVFGAGELPTLNQIVGMMPQTQWAQGALYPESLERASADDLNRIAQTYIATISALNSTARYVTDKHPLNFMNLGLIALLFPECHVIHCKRDPLDTCVSCYMTLLRPAGMDYTQDLASLGSCYRDYERDMRHWRSIAPFRMLEVSYEETVTDLEGHVRRLLEFVELPWNERCLRFHQTRRRVTTPSRHQVRRPIYASSIGRWKHYEKYLGELIAALNPARQ